MLPIEILLVEDSLSDAKLLQRWLGQSPLVERLEIARTGEEALEVLHHRTDTPQADKPDLVLMDVHLPGQSGFEVLEQIRAAPRLKGLPVVLLTGTVSPRAAELARQHGADRCLVKPSDADEFSELVETIEQFWRDLIARSADR